MAIKKRNGTLKWILIFLIPLVVIYIIGRVTGALAFYKIPSYSMEPTLKIRSQITVSNLKKPRRNDIIAFKRVVTERDGIGTPGKMYRFVYRLIAMGGETVEIRNGYAYVDGVAVDDINKLKFTYSAPWKDAEVILKALEEDFGDMTDISSEHDPPVESFGDSLLIELTGTQFLKVKNLTKLNIHPRVSEFDFVTDFGSAAKNWTVNEFGPLKVPADCYFVLGDNRNMAADSRFVGFIPKKNFIGTVLWKK